MKNTITFKEVFGNSPTIKILEFLIESRGLDYSLSDIARNSNIGWTTLHRIWDKILILKFVIPTREIGRAKLYKLNEKNPIIKELIKLYDLLLYQNSEKALSKKIKIVVRN